MVYRKGVVHCFDPAESPTAHDHITDLERAILDDDLGDHAAANLALCFETRAVRRPSRVGLQVMQLGHGHQRFEQLVNPFAGRGAGLDHLGVPPPLAGQQVTGRELLHHAIDVNAGQIRFVEGHNDWHVRRPGMTDGFPRFGA